ncbi:MAG: long-chain fatty acid--CoA ligase [Calditrichaeota bacterium]|nr:MAG: long-chain fatty acid--CoA ligase [Calditrichota bacterium]
MTTVSDTKIAQQVNLFNKFKQVADSHSDRIAFKADGGKGKSYTYGDVRNYIEQLAGFLSADKYAHITEIGLLSENRPEWGITYFAISALGKTVVPIDANLKENEIDYIFKHSNIKLLFTSVRFESFIHDTYEDVEIVSFNEASPNYWVNKLSDSVRIQESRAKLDDVAVLIYTSGTTGDPKAVELTHGNLIANLDAIQRAFEFKENDVKLSVLPLHHTFEATCGFLTPLMNGCCVVYARSLKSKEIVEDIKNNNITIMIGVPLLFEKMYHAIMRKIDTAPTSKRILFKSLYRTSKFGWNVGSKIGQKLFKSLRSKGGLSTIRMFVSGGAAIPPHISEFYNLIGIDFYQGYGMTECAPVVTANRPDDIKFGSCGIALDNVEVKIDKPNEQGVGEILVQGPNVTPGYRNKPEETKKLIRNGWLYTGDLGKLEKGHLVITGRKKNLIVSAAGKNIYPEQIEEKLLQSNLIMESVIFGRPKEGKQGEDICAIIVPDLEQFAQEYQINPEKPELQKIKEVLDREVKKANSEMADFKRINSYEVQLEELEKTSTKKVKRFVYK